MSGSHYEQGLVCVNGHGLTGMLTPQRQVAFCGECGARTVSTCPTCDAPIHGYYLVPGVLGGPPWRPASFCYACGNAYPWTADRIAAAKELADLLDDLKPEEREALKRDFDDLARDTARTTVATMRVKAVLGKVGPEGAAILRKVVGEIATAAVKGQLGLG